jgi:large subunit ribosomal protein L31
MKPNIHPEYHKVKVICSCGASFETMSTFAGKEMRIEICSACHPYFTGKQKLVDTAGRVEKFRERMAKKQELASKKKAKEEKPKEKEPEEAEIPA